MRGEFVEFAIAEPTAVLHALTEWAIGRGEVLDGLAVNRPVPRGRLPVLDR